MRTSAVNDPGEYKVLVNAEISTDRVADQNQDVLLPLRKDGITEGGESQDLEDKVLKDTEVGNRNVGSQGEKAGVQVDIGVISNLNKDRDKDHQIPENTETIGDDREDESERYRYQRISML